MATKVKVKPLDILDPKWSVAEAKPGDSVDLSVTTKAALAAGQSVEIRVKGDQGTIAILTGLTATGNTHKKTWIVPNTLGESKLTFDALLRETPTPANGHVTSRGKVTSAALPVHGFKVVIKSNDEAFVPKAEKLQVKYSVSGAPPKARYEIWGERYPSGQPLYTKDFNPTTGDTTWSDWDGTANAGTLSGKFITPEFSPYRVRVVIGVDAASVADPGGAGKGKVCVAEHAFEVKIEHVVMRIQKGLAAATTTAVNNFIKINPRKKNDAYDHQGRLPTTTESARMRIPTAIHQAATDDLGQGGDLVTGPYVSATAGGNKWARDSGIHTRPELPIEFEPHLTSRDPAKNGAKHGVYEGSAVGPLLIEPFVEEHYDEAFYTGADVPTVYRRNAAHKIKRGQHNLPVNDGTNPIIGYWQARVKVKVEPTETIDLGAIDADFKYNPGTGELAVYKNRMRLKSALPAAKFDVEETDATHIKLKAKLAKIGDVIWIVRDDLGAVAPNKVAKWIKYPPGPNCHEHYGGVRGDAPNNLFRDDFSAAPAAPKQAIIGAGTAWPYKANVELKPNKPPAGTDEERVEVKALEPVGANPAANWGMAGIIFSPSYIAGDGYVLAAQLAPFPYQRTLGFFSSKPRHQVKTGPLTVFRVVTIQRSVRLPDVGSVTGGYPAGIGNPADPAIAGRAYHGDGINMDVAAVNTELERAFMEWVVTKPAPGADVHIDVTAANYIAAHNGAASGGGTAAGRVTVTNGAGTASDVNNQFIRFDPYRVRLPPGTPAADRASITAAVNALQSGSSTLAAMAAARAQIGAGGGAGGTPIYPAAGGAMGYFWWFTGINLTIAGNLMNAAALTPGSPTSSVINVVRWPDFYQVTTWTNGTPIGGTYTNANNTTGVHITGYSAGNGQSYFSTVSGDATTFAHELGHSLHLFHFAGGNFCWKHHNLMSQGCKMTYNWTHGYIPQPAVVVGAGATEDTGWPDTVPAVIPQGSQAPTAPPAIAGASTIEITSLAKVTRAAVIPVGDFCPKCVLKLRGWKDEELPVAWRHPDLL